jgi:sirohydrochlorin ferrochelatase
MTRVLHMMFVHQRDLPACALLGACLALAFTSPLRAEGQAADPADHSGHAGHKMEPWMYEALRQRVDLYRTYTDAEIDDSMVRMGPDYTSYLSAADTRGTVGVLVLAHGYGKVGDEAFRNGLAPVAGKYPTAVAFGMSMTASRHIQQALDELTAAGADGIVVVPALSSSASDDQLRQWQYMFGLTDDPGYLQTPRVMTKARVTWTPALEDHPLVIDMIADYAREMSTDPAKELVLLVSHGPTLDADNARNLALLERIAAGLKARDGYADVKVMSMQNDAPVDIRQANGLTLRRYVEDANRDGKRVIIVTNLQSPRSIQQQVEDDIAGTDYVFNTKGLVQHPNYARWVEAMAQAAITDRPATDSPAAPSATGHEGRETPAVR